MQGNHTNEAELGLSKISGSLGSSVKGWRFQVASSTHGKSVVSMQKIFSVSASGNHTFHGTGREDYGNVRVDGKTLSLVVFPVSHGTVSE